MSNPALPTSRTAAERAVAERLTRYMADAKAGTAKPTPHKRPPSPLLDHIERAYGIAPAAQPAHAADRSPVGIGQTALKREAWESLTEAEQLAVNAGDEEAKATYDARYAVLCDQQDEPAEAIEPE
jgi:hypothetical protein